MCAQAPRYVSRGSDTKKQAWHIMEAAAGSLGLQGSNIIDDLPGLTLRWFYLALVVLNSLFFFAFINHMLPVTLWDARYCCLFELPVQLQILKLSFSPSFSLYSTLSLPFITSHPWGHLHIFLYCCILYSSVVVIVLAGSLCLKWVMAPIL